MDILNILKSMQDEDYKNFYNKILGVPLNIIGCRIPNLKKLAKNMVYNNEYYEFLNQLPHYYYDENMLHGLVVGYLPYEPEMIKNYIMKFLPYLDNWSVCDSMVANLKIFKNNSSFVFDIAKSCLSNDDYIRRFGIVIMINYLIKTKYCKQCCELLLGFKDTKFYYNQMATAWFFCEVAVEHFEFVCDLIKNNNISEGISIKLVNKILNSYKFNKNQKNYIKKLYVDRNFIVIIII